ncbi:Trypanosoma vivax [Trypanosoma rangeli]|uniref:Trypanosoma vivax n=1 Tax=Trypanosoma rangeli TaxID=5698 RepID=A0A422NJD5_TRYRA|nr:Trypanosoma vivax [Trypanosoma rangeli]RNF05590.1 Trypanosoma vivax [Trypanosoma rangeli]|eukprot:RNF05590.1 Trypanosoma vivax [Trypanosoma rangeli]
MAYQMGEPVICAVYPTCVFFCWDPPRPATAAIEANRSLSWTYEVEWVTSHNPNKKHSSGATPYCHAVIEVIYPNEVMNIRVVARANVSADVVAYSSTSCTMNAGVTIAMPWLHKKSMECRCIFDGLLFSTNGAQCIEAIPDELDYVKATIASVYMLESSFACIIVKAVYGDPPLPITTSAVYYFVVCSKALVRQRERLRHSGIQELLEKGEASAVFCGIGEMGSSATLAAHIFIASIPDSLNRLRARVFCIAYGTPRRMFFEDSLVLASTLAFSGNFLYYTGLLEAPDPSSGYKNRPPPPQVIKGKEAVNDTALRFNAPLGVRCGPLLDLQEGRRYLRTRCSGLETLSEEECHEHLDVSQQLRILSHLLLPGGEAVLLPAIKAVEHTVEDGVVVCLHITGANLQYRPQICVSSHGGWPTQVSVTHVSPRQINATFSLVAMLSVESSKRLKPLRRLRVDFAFLTDIGHTSYVNYTIDVPEDVAELIFLENRSEIPHSWIFSQPMNLINNAIVIEPLLTTPMTKEPRKFELVRQASTEILEALYSIGEIGSYYVIKKQNVGLLSFVANVAAKVSTSSMTSQSMTPMTIEAPLTRERVFERKLGEYINSKKRAVSSLLSSLATWKQRLHRGLPWMCDTNYRDKLCYLLSVFEQTRPAPDTSLVSLEISLFTFVLRFLRNTCGVENLQHLISLHHYMSFEKFYQLVYPVFLASTPTLENAAFVIVLESAALWAVCLIFHLRCSYLFKHLIAVTGCSGCGCTTICNALARLCMEQDYSFRNSQRVRNILICHSVENELDDLKEVLLLGVSVTVVVVGEFADIKGMGYKAIWGSIRRSVRNAENQRIYAFISKVDELVGLCSGRGSELDKGVDLVAVLRDTALASVSAGGAGRDVPKHLVAVSFAPSVSFLKSSRFLQLNGVSAEAFAERLLTVSLGELRRILLRVRKRSHH